LLLFGGIGARGDTFGNGGNTFTIDFVTIGNAGNANDAAGPTYTDDGGQYASPRGGVGYTFRMAVVEVPQDWITKATALGMQNVTAGAFSGMQPAANMTWFETAAFANWLNVSAGYQPAYNLTFNDGWTMNLWSSSEAWQLGGENRYRHKDAHYFLPSENEWYKAAYHKNDGVTANYWDYATASNDEPTAVVSGKAEGSAVYGNVSFGPAAVDDNGGLSAYGTRGQGGNVREWTETASSGFNLDPFSLRPARGGGWNSPIDGLQSAYKIDFSPSDSFNFIGFRIASIPEPSTALNVVAGAMLLSRRRRAA
jgi:formylglycine-generating enzyme required for sulfatase activity